LIKGIHLEGLRVLGLPQEYALDYYTQGIDELIYMDCVASLYGRNHLCELVTATANEIFVPITVGGGIRSVADVSKILRAGADKVAINTAAIANPQLITDVARAFGSQCMVLSVEAKLVGHEKWEAYTNNGRERTGVDLIEWVKKGVSMGAGEILITSIDREGTRKGFDISLVKAISTEVLVPVIASGGMGKLSDLSDVVEQGMADAVAIADMLHYKRASVKEIKSAATKSGICVRTYG